MMNFFGKRKNDEARRLSPWLMLVIGFVLGAALMFLLFNRPVGQTTASVTYVFPTLDLDMTATAIIAGVTGTAQSQPAQGNSTVDGLYQTATAIVAGATATMMSLTQQTP
jgi:hypothetical protein